MEKDGVVKFLYCEYATEKISQSKCTNVPNAVKYMN